MKKDYRVFLYLGIIISCLAMISLIFLNTIFYDYKGKLQDSLDNYYSSEENNVDSINSIINRYKNNTSKTKVVDDIIESDVNNRIKIFNTIYDTKEQLEKAKDQLLDKLDYFFNNIKLDFSDKKEGYLVSVNNLYESKSNYLVALNYFEENDYNNAYEYFNKVIKSDSYFDDTTTKIDIMFENVIEQITNGLSGITISETVDGAVTSFKNAINYLNEQKDSTKFNLNISKTFSETLKSYLDKLKVAYVNYAKKLREDNKIDEALKIVDEGITILSKNEYDSKELIELKDEYSKMLPINMYDLEYISVGTSFNKDLNIADINNDNYPKAISISNTNGSITYNLNKEYKNLSITLSLGKEVNEKNKNYGKIKIISDNKTIYDSKDITKNFAKKNLKLDVSNCNNLKIEYTTSSSKQTTKSDIIVMVLGDLTLSKY